MLERSLAMTRSRSLSFASLGLLAAFSLAGCSNDPSTAAQFQASTTAPAPGLVKLEQKSRSGERLIVDVRMYGPEPALDLFAFRFGIRIGDADLVRLAAQMSYPQNALVAGNGQTISMNVDPSDPTLIRVEVTKQGGGAGNGFAAASAVVIELPFDVRQAGATSLTLTGLGNGAPQALDSNQAVIGAVRFDDASATVRGVSTGGGRY
jgi:hypothetical protein